MRGSAFIVAAGLLAVSTASWATDNTGAPGSAPGRMQGSPNAAGFGKSDATKAETTGTTGAGAASQAPGQEMKQDGRMQGPPNAAGFKGEGASSGSGGSR